ncbi:MAG: hypothetical protein AB1478_03615, partial [Nitrospirota bacterium]
SGKFVEKMIEEAEERQKSQFTVLEHMKIVSDVIRSTCLKEGTNPSELKGGSRRRHISQIRQQIAHVLVEEHGIAMATVAREVGVTTAAISRMLKANLAKID